MLAARGLARGDRVALLSRNRPEYFEIELAAANLGAITACLNWRLSKRELAYCVDLVSPKLLIVEDELSASLEGLAGDGCTDHYPRCRIRKAVAPIGAQTPPIAAEPEDGLVILYTSGTTGLPKGAVVSHRAMTARALVFSSELNIAPAILRGVGAALSHGVDRSWPCHAAARRHRRDLDGFQIGPLSFPSLHATGSAGSFSFRA